MLIVCSVFALLGTGRSFGGGRWNSFGQMLFSVIFCFIVVILISVVFSRTYFSAAEIFGTVIITPVLAIMIFAITAQFKRPE
jgi:ABC-type Fe3+ transport system permease subunit